MAIPYVFRHFIYFFFLIFVYYHFMHNKSIILFICIVLFYE